MPRQRILDSHIHLWPQSAANSSSHSWMNPGDHLAHQYSIEQYLFATSTESAKVLGFVYVETDRRIGHGKDVADWAAEPLKELQWLRRIVEETPEEGEGHAPEHAEPMKGIVAWAPLDRGVEAFRAYLREARKAAGEKTWERVKGFRFLLQGIKDEAYLRRLVLGEDCVQTLREFKRNGNAFTFDVGVDQRSGGVWQLDIAAEMIEKVHEGVDESQKTTFVLNHLCKPAFEYSPAERKEAFDRWTACMERFAKCDRVYMKLSGAFSELGDQDPSSPWPTSEVIRKMKPWLDVIFRCFSPGRIMFGSDWPVCNVRGPGDEWSWRSWKAVVEAVLDLYGLSDKDKDQIWFGTAVDAYKLENAEYT